MPPVSAIILAGGRGLRMGGIDKGLALLNHQTLIQHVTERLAPQVDEIFINANREIARYETLNLPILQDEQPDFIGPLAGFSLGLKHCKHDYLLTAPCDAPLMPNDLVSKLMQSLTAENADIAVAKSGGNTHPVFCLMKKSVLPSLTQFINEGNRKVSLWQKSLPYVEVSFDDCNHAFVNLNTFEALDALALQLSNV